MPFYAPNSCPSILFPAGRTARPVRGCNPNSKYDCVAAADFVRPTLSLSARCGAAFFAKGASRRVAPLRLHGTPDEAARLPNDTVCHRSPTAQGEKTARRFGRNHISHPHRPATPRSLPPNKNHPSGVWPPGGRRTILRFATRHGIRMVSALESWPASANQIASRPCLPDRNPGRASAPGPPVDHGTFFQVSLEFSGTSAPRGKTGGGGASAAAPPPHFS